MKPRENWHLFQGPQEMWLRDKRVNPLPSRSCCPCCLGRFIWPMALPGTQGKRGWCQSGVKAMLHLAWPFSDVWGVGMKCCIVQMYRTSSLLWSNFGQPRKSLLKGFHLWLIWLQLFGSWSYLCLLTQLTVSHRIFGFGRDPTGVIESNSEVNGLYGN